MEDAYRSSQGNKINVLDDDVVQIEDASGKITGDISVYGRDSLTNNIIDGIFKKISGLEQLRYSVITDANFNQVGDRIITLGKDRKVKLWNLSGKLIKTFRHDMDADIELAQFSPSGAHIVTSGWRSESGNGWSTFWNKTWDLEPISGPISYLWSISGDHLATVSGSRPKVSPREDRVLTLNDIGGVTIWDLSGRRLAELKSKRGLIRDADFSVKGDQIIMSLDDGSVQVESNETLPQMLTRGCYWLRSYLEDNPGYADRLDQLPTCRTVFEKSEP
jgi:WD40 repeat protein